MPVHMSDDDFEELVVDALDTIPPHLAELIDNVVVRVETRAGDEPGLLGLYTGVDLTARGAMSYGDGLEMPDQVLIYREPHLETADDVEALRELVVETVLHEIAHHFGIDDDRLDELGWS
ncbi:MAG: metallopeptidase family protein [Acidimicrobiia bacterium]|nr:metallopeptidase family protein [Acidimicrobiia bacterium]